MSNSKVIPSSINSLLILSIEDCSLVRETIRTTLQSVFQSIANGDVPFCVVFDRIRKTLFRSVPDFVDVLSKAVFFSLASPNNSSIKSLSMRSRSSSSSSVQAESEGWRQQLAVLLDHFVHLSSDQRMIPQRFFFFVNL